MWKNKGHAITRDMLRPGGRSGTEVCSTTLIMAVGFIWTFIVCLFAWGLSFFGFNDYTHSSNYVVIVNAPDSFIDYELSEPSVDNRIFYEEYDAPYDFMKMSELMREHAAGIALVFPDNFDESVSSGMGGQILTYYRTDTLDYMNIRDGFTGGYLKGYEAYLIDRYDLDIRSAALEVIRDDIPTDDGIPWNIRFANSMGRTFIPILLFIAILYAAMSTGTEAISGQKERGTFSRLLLSPVSRKDIVVAFTEGVFISASLPALVIYLIVFLMNAYRHVGSVIPVLLLILSLAFFISALTVLISIMNNSVSSAQTAFLPIFFILITIAVTCINGDSDTERPYYFIPIYGQFYGIGDALNGSPDILASVVCSLITALMGYGVMKVCNRLLLSERFTTTIEPSDDPDEIKAPNIVERILGAILSGIDIVLYPLAVLSVFQLLAMIPVIVAYMRDPLYSNFIMELSEVSTVTDIVTKTMEIIGIFMNDSRYLALMTISYILIIIVYIKRASGASGVGLTIKNFPRNYGFGLLLGSGLMTLVFLLLVTTGKTTVEGFGLTGNTIPVFIFSVLMWIPQGASEEVMFRGFMIPKLKALFGGKGTPVAIIISSSLFALFHGLNQGVTWLAIVNIFLIAVLFALIYEATGSIVMTCGAHTMWNLFQGNIYGLSVSGNASVPALITTTYEGSAFGPEGTAEATVVIVLALAVMGIILYRKRSSRKAS
ncbi:MAG: CPBP family intramembrane metalloprotease [Clostridiales bacterium]|nr:CPBP family intramembrane metalloprotease [Clostridiales bacterium]